MLEKMREVYDYLQAKVVMFALTSEEEYEVRMGRDKTSNALTIVVYNKTHSMQQEFRILFNSSIWIRVYNPEYVVKMYSVGVDRTKSLTLDDLYRAFDAIWGVSDGV